MSKKLFAATLVLSSGLLVLAAPAQAADAAAAQAWVKDAECFKCHTMDKTKKGPPWKKIAAKYKGKADAEAKIHKHLTSGPKVKLEDGTEEEHKIVEASDEAQMKNFISWLLTL
ncbi:MAG TPA: c-type cytochrome [Rhodocyclaceae bacterium]